MRQLSTLGLTLRPPGVLLPAEEEKDKDAQAIMTNVSGGITGAAQQSPKGKSVSVGGQLSNLELEVAFLGVIATCQEKKIVDKQVLLAI